MKKINWCKKQEKGVKLIEPNDNLSEEYFQNSEESLRVLKSITETKSTYLFLGIKRTRNPVF